jgi:hypothetical protein
VRSFPFNAACILTLHVCLTGCTVQTVHPISEIGKVIHDKGLAGEWRHWSPEFHEWDNVVQISEGSAGYYHYRLVDPKHPLCFAGRLVAVGDDCYLEMLSQGSENKAIGPFDTHVNSYLFVRVCRDGDELTIRAPEYRALKAAVENRSVQGIVADGRVVLTSPADVVCNYLKANEEKIFGEPQRLQRVRSTNTN